MRVGEWFRARFNVSDESGLLVRAYIHDCGFSDAYHGDILETVRHVYDVVENSVSGQMRDDGVGCAIALTWGENGEKRIDFFGYGVAFEDLGSEWKSNMEVRSYLTKGEILLPPNRGIGCEDGMWLFARESEYRRTTPNPFFYLSRPPIVLGADKDEYDFCLPGEGDKLNELLGRAE